MKPAFFQRLDELRRISETSSVVLLPGHLLWVRAFVLPEGLARSELPGFAELCLEGASPFPLENLAWGYFAPEAADHLLTFATPLERLRREGYEDLEKARQVLPDFFPALLLPPPENPRLRKVITPRSLCLLQFSSPGQILPDKVLSRALPTTTEGKDASANFDSKALEAFLASMREDLPGHPPEEVPCHAVAGAISGSGRSIRAQLWKGSLRDLPSGLTFPPDALQTVPLALPPAALWAADLRSAAFAREERRRRSQARRLWAALIGITSFALILLILQLSLWGLHAWNDSRQQRISSQQPQVEIIQSKDDLASKLESFAQRELRPFAMLQVLNAVRATNIHFTKVTTTDWNRMRVEGESRTGQDFSSFLQRLENDPQIESVEVLRLQTRRGMTPFTLEVIFPQLPPLPPVPPPSETEEDESDSDTGDDESPPADSTGEGSPPGDNGSIPAPNLILIQRTA